MSAIDLEIIMNETQEGKKQELRLWLRLLSTTKLISQEIRRRLRREFGATLPQFDLLSQLYREPEGLRLGELSKRTMVTNGNITGLVERLEIDGLVVRERPADDRRVIVACLTEKGRTTFEAMAEAHGSWLEDMMGDVDPIVISGLLTHVGQVKQSARNHLSGDERDEI
ncbi:MarR family winged helix-turn-helix transcriptional regulator [Agrobacterium rubi]|uniref:MarR family transcriptional regulator n=2 Tax=Agrobacterium rubi TaxID=28099 RepID=A0AAE7UT37_9HYPH|nr:MarR family transcriptional regulator [Agrobacterium rubi]MBP1878916.1 DNA-binding MarR family transcriptional regulator [Agrobacterium rubi]NTE87400.1 MarR family transcriptional regulator [Agrobacterium rubi]NTF03254.1 MarR family transcriptional regulator [Agrobacterium rubi]NTF09829.1 MarR family transcriptional regulator [Agrobacterium rubi]NTF21994.1 MarR family transcriptional regulator [Agrobacterium rubi]